MVNFSSPVQFYWIIPFCSKYFVRDCRRQISVETENFEILDQLAKKWYFWSKTEEVSITIEFCIFELGYNSVQDIWNEIEKSSKAGQDKKSLISTFGYL